MTRKIKAQDVKPGMEVEFTREGWVHRGTVGAVETDGDQTWFYAVGTKRVRYVSANQEVTVLKEPQPDEPTAFGAAVEAGGVWFVRIDVRDLEDPDFQPWQSDSLIQSTWAEVCDQGQVTVVNADPFATPAQGKTEPRVWERWEEVPDMVAVKVPGLLLPHRKGRGWVEEFDCYQWRRVYRISEGNVPLYGPFTEVV